MSHRICGLIPTYDNPETIGRVAAEVARHLERVFIVDDGSHPRGRAAVVAAATHERVTAIHRETNGGKGAAVKDGLQAAHDAGFTHALQVDADGQHELGQIPALVRISKGEPRALLLGSPRFDASAPAGRLWARKITVFWTRQETAGPVIEDPMCGFRVYPLEAALKAAPRADRMDFDIEVAVRIAWQGTPVINIPTRVRYLSDEEGGVSHFDLVKDNIAISRTHNRLMIERLRADLGRLWSGLRGEGHHTDDAPRKNWLEVRERGSVAGIAITATLARLSGRRVTRALLRPIAAYYARRAAVAWRASREYQARLRAHTGDDRPVAESDIYAHILTFAEASLDRLFFVQGEARGIEFTRQGREHLQQLAREKRGAILLGAHLGSFEAMRFVGRAEEMKINVLAYVANARMINDLLQRLDPSSNTRVIELRPGRLDGILEAQAALARGEHVAILGDRVGLNDKTATVDVFGKPARLPTGPYLMASAIGCPVYLTFGLYHRPNHYALYCEPFAERIRLPRGAARADALRSWAERYARRLEHYCTLAPQNWFNFYDFWSA